jgi:hypothetical protein
MWVIWEKNSVVVLDAPKNAVPVGPGAVAGFQLLPLLKSPLVVPSHVASCAHACPVTSNRPAAPNSSANIFATRHPRVGDPIIAEPIESKISRPLAERPPGNVFDVLQKGQKLAMSLSLRTNFKID